MCGTRAAARAKKKSQWGSVFGGTAMRGDQQIQRRSLAKILPAVSLLWPVFRRAAFLPSCAAILLFLAFFYLPERWLAGMAWHLYLDQLHPIFTAPATLLARAWLGGAAAITLFLCLSFAALLMVPRRRYIPRLSADAPHGGSWSLSVVDQAVLDDLIGDQSVGQHDDAPTADAACPDEGIGDDAAAAHQGHGGGAWPRNHWDRHPDDAPRAPISAQRELPAGGLDGPLAADPHHQGDRTGAADRRASAAAYAAQDAAWDHLLSDDVPADHPDIVGTRHHDLPDDVAEPNRPAAHAPPPREGEGESAHEGEEPWLQSVEQGGPAAPSADDISLSALVARLEARLARRRRPATQMVADVVPMPVPDPPPMTVADHQIDLALEAALGTLQRMNLRAAG